MLKIAVILPNYNMPEAAERTYADLEGSAQADLYIIDNGSDLVDPAEHTRVLIPKNCQTTGAFMHGIAAANKSGVDYIAYCFMITSTSMNGGSRQGDRSGNVGARGIASAVNIFQRAPNLVGYSPTLTKSSTTAWKHMFARPFQPKSPPVTLLSGQRPTWMIDNICAFWRKDWFDSIGQFDLKMTYAWGIDLETSWKARSQGRDIVLDDFWQVHKDTDVGYDMGRMNMTAEERTANARAEMAEVLGKKYGPNWSHIMRTQFVTEEML